MIDNNLRQLKFDSARGGADIERACALRDIERGGGDSEPTERLAEIDRRIEQLEDEHRTLVAEREWLNRSLLEFDDQAAGKSEVSHMNAGSESSIVRDAGQLTEEDRSKDEHFVKLAHFAEVIIHAWKRFCDGRARADRPLHRRRKAAH